MNLFLFNIFLIFFYGASSSNLHRFSDNAKSLKFMEHQKAVAHYSDDDYDPSSVGKEEGNDVKLIGPGHLRLTVSTPDPELKFEFSRSECRGS